MNIAPVAKYSPMKKVAVATTSPKKLSIKFSTPSASAISKSIDVEKRLSMPKLTLKLNRNLTETPTKAVEPKIQKIKLKLGSFSSPLVKSVQTHSIAEDSSDVAVKVEESSESIVNVEDITVKSEQQATPTAPFKLKLKLKPRPE